MAKKKKSDNSERNNMTEEDTKKEKIRKKLSVVGEMVAITVFVASAVASSIKIIGSIKNGKVKEK